MAKKIGPADLHTANSAAINPYQSPADIVGKGTTTFIK
jgi:hypothetical protein